MKTTIWFRHDSDAREDERCSTLIARTGYEGYGIYWAIIEMLHTSDCGSFSQENLDGIAFALRVDLAKLKQVLDTCLAVGLLEQEKTQILSRRLLRERKQIEEVREKRKKAGKKGGLNKAKTLASAKQMPSKIKQSKSKSKSKSNNILPSNEGVPVDEHEEEFRKVLLFASELFGSQKTFSPDGLAKWKSRRKKFSARELAEALGNIRNEPDQWKLKNNGHRPLSWWLRSDEYIVELQNCHLKGGSKVVFIS